MESWKIKHLIGRTRPGPAKRAKQVRGVRSVKLAVPVHRARFLTFARRHEARVARVEQGLARAQESLGPSPAPRLARQLVAGRSRATRAASCHWYMCRRTHSVVQFRPLDRDPINLRVYRYILARRYVYIYRARAKSEGEVRGTKVNSGSPADACSYGRALSICC